MKNVGDFRQTHVGVNSDPFSAFTNHKFRHYEVDTCMRLPDTRGCPNRNMQFTQLHRILQTGNTQQESKMGPLASASLLLFLFFFFGAQCLLFNQCLLHNDSPYRSVFPFLHPSDTHRFQIILNAVYPSHFWSSRFSSSIRLSQQYVLCRPVT